MYLILGVHNVILLLSILGQKISTIVMTNYKSTSTVNNDEETKYEKCRRIIELAFGPEKPIPEDSTTGPTIPDSQIVTFKTDVTGKISEKNPNLAGNNIVNATTPEEGGEKLIQKVEKIEETPLVDAEHKQADELKTNRTSVLFSDRDISSVSCELRRDKNILDELAKRCMNAPKDKIDSKLLEEMEKIGILQPYSHKAPNVPAMEDEIVLIGCPRKYRRSRKKKDKEVQLEVPILERETFKMPGKNFLNRRAMRHLNVNSESRDISDIKMSAQRETPVILETDAETPTENKEPGILNSAQTLTEEQEQNKNLNVKNIGVQDSSAINASVSFNLEKPEQNNMEEIINNLYEERTQLDSSTVFKTSENAPAVILSKELSNVDDFRITPDESPDVSGKTTVRYKHAGQSELDIGLEEIKRVFDEEKVPLHPFVDLTNSGVEKISQKGKIQGLESGLDLSAPEYSLDGITMTEHMTEKFTSLYRPCAKKEIDSSNTTQTTGTTLTAKTTNLKKNNDLSNPMISSTMVQFSEAAADTASLKENVKSSIESPENKTKAELKSFIDNPTSAIHMSETTADIASLQEKKTDAESNSFIDTPAEASDPQAAETTKEVKFNEEMSLSELLKRVRQKSRYETYEQIMFTSQVPQAEPYGGKPPCTPLANPPPKTLPPRPCPPKPKKDKKDKKNPCAKFQKDITLDTIGLILIRVPKIEILENHSFTKKGLDVKRIPKFRPVMLVPHRLESLEEDEDHADISNIIVSNRLHNFKEYESWDLPFLLISQDRKKK